MRQPTGGITACSTGRSTTIAVWSNATGCRVRTACDGEIIPQLWAKLGVASLAELRGMFAIALVDTAEERLYLARDPLGIKPLHWRVLA